MERGQGPLLDDSRGTRPTGPGWAAEAADPVLLERFRRFLVDEAIPAGGLGPAESSRLEDRHIHDSLGLSLAWHAEPAPEKLLDLGSGVGLPGIPLAVLWKDCEIGLVERSGRRARLLRRAVRILDLQRVIVIESDIIELDAARWVGAGIVMRAAIPPRRVLDVVNHVEWERLAVSSGDDDDAEWGARRRFEVFARQGWVRTLRRT